MNPVASIKGVIFDVDRTLISCEHFVIQVHEVWTVFRGLDFYRMNGRLIQWILFRQRKASH